MAMIMFHAWRTRRSTGARSADTVAERSPGPCTSTEITWSASTGPVRATTAPDASLSTTSVPGGASRSTSAVVNSPRSIPRSVSEMINVSACPVRRRRASARTSLANRMPLVKPAIVSTANTSASTERSMRLRKRVAIGLDSRVQQGKGERMSALLLVEDDGAIAGPLMRALGKAGYDTTWVGTGGDAERAVLDATPELVVLDVGLPDIDGIEVCRRLRSIDDRLPIIVLTARREELDIVEGFEAGADDYLTKPFRLSELLARIRARLRAVGATRLESDDITVDIAARRAWQADRELGLSTKEF